MEVEAVDPMAGHVRRTSAAKGSPDPATVPTRQRPALVVSQTYGHPAPGALRVSLNNGLGGDSDDAQHAALTAHPSGTAAGGEEGKGEEDRNGIAAVQSLMYAATAEYRSETSFPH